MPRVEPLEKYIGKRPKNYSGGFEPIPPLENYTPAPSPQRRDFPGQGEIMDISRRDSPNFGRWMREAGGFHFDEAQKGFVPDKMRRDFMQEISQVMERGGNVADQVLTRFKDRMAAAPREALADLAEYEQVNPVGSALGFMGNVVAGKTARGFKQAETLGRVFGGAVDQLPRFEISDAESVLKGLPKAMQESRLEDVLDHPELYQNYPDLADVKVRKQIPTTTSEMSGFKGEYNPKTDQIMVAPGDDAKETLIHEIQHAIQNREKFDFSEPEAYRVQDRMNLTDAERQARPFNETFDVPAGQQILRRKSGNMSSMEDEAKKFKTPEDFIKDFEKKAPSRLDVNNPYIQKKLTSLWNKVNDIPEPKPYSIKEDKFGNIQIYTPVTQEYLWVNPETINKFLSEGKTKYDAARFVVDRDISMAQKLGKINETLKHQINVEKVIGDVNSLPRRKTNLEIQLKDFLTEMERLKS